MNERLSIKNEFFFYLKPIFHQITHNNYYTSHTNLSMITCSAWLSYSLFILSYIYVLVALKVQNMA